MEKKGGGDKIYVTFFPPKLKKKTKCEIKM